jgi:DNA-binding LacI/PurR family transcriptional regulator
MNIREIAKIVKCSPSTVSRVLSDKKCDIKISDATRKKILETCERFDYQPSIHAARFFSKESKTIGLVTPQTPGLDDYSLSRVMDTVYRGLNKHGYRMLPLIKDDKFIERKEYFDIFKRGEIDALIIWGLEGSNTDWVDELSEAKLPFILISNKYKEYPCITCDDFSGMKGLAERCIEKGARKLLYLSCLKVDCCERRKEGFLAAAEGNSEYEVIELNNLMVEDGIKAARAISARKPDAVVCVNDKVAIGLMLGLRKYDLKIPEDIMITGADNVEMAEWSMVPLTTYDNRVRECGEKCVELLMAHLKEGIPLASYSFPPAMYVRDSA